MTPGYLRARAAGRAARAERARASAADTTLTPARALRVLERYPILVPVLAQLRADRIAIGDLFAEAAEAGNRPDARWIQAAL